MCWHYRPCEFLGFVWTDCWGDKSNYVITSPANFDTLFHTHNNQDHDSITVTSLSMVCVCVCVFFFLVCLFVLCVGGVWGVWGGCVGVLCFFFFF